MAYIQLKCFAFNCSDTARFVKAGIRDIKAYRQSKNYRDIPVGYSGGMYSDIDLAHMVAGFPKFGKALANMYY